MISHGGQRFRTLSKSYVSLFIYLATRAIHLELVSDLTANAFIAALRRFMARRGIPSQLYSDNGTNFRKARNVLRDLYNLWHKKDATSTIQSFTTSALVTSFWWSLGERYKKFEVSFAPRCRQVHTHVRGVYYGFVTGRGLSKFTSIICLSLIHI